MEDTKISAPSEQDKLEEIRDDGDNQHDSCLTRLYPRGFRQELRALLKLAWPMVSYPEQRRIQKIRNRGGGGRNRGGGRLRQNQVLAVCTERSTGKSPRLPYHYGSERGARAPGAPPPLIPLLLNTGVLSGTGLADGKVSCSVSKSFVLNRRELYGEMFAENAVDLAISTLP